MRRLRRRLSVLITALLARLLRASLLHLGRLGSLLSRSRLPRLRRARTLLAGWLVALIPRLLLPTSGSLVEPLLNAFALLAHDLFELPLYVVERRAEVIAVELLLALAL